MTTFPSQSAKLRPRKADQSQRNGCAGVPSADPGGRPSWTYFAVGERFLVCSHTRPDGDALGSMVACAMLLRADGQAGSTWLPPTMFPPSIASFPGADGIRSALEVSGPYDAVDFARMRWAGARADCRGLSNTSLINIDHHMSGSGYAHLNWIDCEAPSAGEMIYRLVRAAGATVTPEMATCLYTTLLTDTGGFCYGSICAYTFELARELTVAGADPVRIAQQVCFSTPISKMLLLGSALNNLHREGRMAWLWVTHQDMVRTCAARRGLRGNCELRDRHCGD